MLQNRLRMLAIAAAVSASCNTLASETDLFEEPLTFFDNETIDAESALHPSQPNNVQVLTGVKLNENLTKNLSVDQFISFEIDGRYHQIQITEISTPSPEINYVTGVSLDGKSHLSLVQLDKRIAARLSLGNHSYLITAGAANNYKIVRFQEDNREIDKSPTTGENPEFKSTLSSGNAHLARLTSANMVAQTEPVTVVVAYTAKLAAEVGDVEAYLALMEKDTNDSYAASGINARVDIIHAYQTGYISTGDMSEDNSVLLNKNTSSWLPNPNPLAPNGFGVELKSKRDQFQADVMVFLADQNAASPWAGWAGQIGTDETHALFTISSWGTFKNTFAHELGHLYGARHDNDATATPFAYGHGYCNDAKTWRTMMAISDCGTRLNAWSNPNETYEGEAGGTIEKHDNARVHNERMNAMASLRTSAHIPPTASISQINVTPGDLSVSFSGFAIDNDGSVQSVLWDFGDTVYHNTPYAQGENVYHTYPFPGNYSVRMTATDNEGLIHSVTQDISVSAAPGASYCAVRGQNAIYQFISNVSANGNSIDSGRRQFTDHTQSDPFNLYAGSATGLSLQQGTRSRDFGPYAAYWAIYVDLNHNNSFDDPGELLHFSSPRGDASREPVLANITIPESALAGETRMRIIQSNTLRDGESQLAPCGDFTFGEAEDFTVNIIKDDNPADFSFSVDVDSMQVEFSGNTQNVASVEWDFGDALYSNSNTSSSFTPSHNYAFGGVYTVTLTVTLNNGETYTQTKVVELPAPEGQNFCRAHGNQPAYQYTANVTLNGNSIDSGSSHYTFHRGEQLGAVHGENSIIVRQGATGSSSSYNANWRIYLDMNQNGIFEDTESVWYWIGANTNTAIKRYFSIPTSALPGKTRMRVIQSYEDITSACGESRWGEVEDFEVVILAENPAEFTTDISANNLTVQFHDSKSSNTEISEVHYDFGNSKVSSSFSTEQSNPAFTYDYSGDYEVVLTTTMNNGIKYQSRQNIAVSGPAVCAAWGESNTQWTSRVRLDSLINDSEKSGFTHYQDTGFVIASGSSAEIGLTHDSNGPYLANWAVFIDLNNNRSFEESERLLQTSATTFDEVIDTITIPEGTSAGETLMRVVQSYELQDDKVPACGAISWGEVEDYKVLITSENQNQSDLINGVTKTGISVAAQEEKTFSFYVPEGATDVTVFMQAGTGDPDLYVKFEDQNTTTNWLCRPYIGGNNDETCSSDTLTQSGGTYYVTVKGWTASDNVTLTGTYNEADVITPTPSACESQSPQTRGNLTNNEAICLGNQTVYVAIYLPAGQSELTITTRAGDDDASLFQRNGGWPQSNNYDNAATTINSNEETITLQNPASGWHYIMVTGQGQGTELLAVYQ